MVGLVRQLLRRPWRTLVLVGTLTVGGAAAYRAGWHVWADRHWRAVPPALERRDFAAARAHLALCLRVWPDSAETHLLAARAARRAGAYDDAGQHLDACQRLGGDPTALALERTLLAAQQGDLAGGETFLLACLDQDLPDGVLILEALAQGYMKAYRMPDARRCLERWLERRPDDLQALLWHGWVMEHLSRYPEALADYRRAITLAPTNEHARLSLGDVLLFFNQPQEALEHFEYLRQHAAPSAAVLLGLARCRSGMGQTEEARQLLDRLLADYPAQPQVLSERGKLALQAGQPAEAEPWLRQAAALLPHDLRTTYALYQCLEQCGKREEARDYLVRAERIRADLRRLHEVMEKMAAAPRDLALRCEAGQLFLRNGEDKEGLRWLASVLQEDPEHRPAHAALADYYERAGDPTRAARHRRLARPHGGAASG
jgi:tetratricopeptide (TPR) repeat protein